MSSNQQLPRTTVEKIRVSSMVKFARPDDVGTRPVDRHTTSQSRPAEDDLSSMVGVFVRVLQNGPIHLGSPERLATASA